MDKQHLPRHSAGSFELKEGTGPITAMISYDGFVEMYKVDKTFHVQSPKGIDPDETNSNAPWVMTPISDVGSSNTIIARVLLQSRDILDGACFKHEVDKKEVLGHLYECKENLLACQKIYNEISQEIDNILSKTQSEGIKTQRNDRGISSFPHVQELKTKCHTFLIKANLAIQNICALASTILKLQKRDKNFDHLTITLQPIFSENTDIQKFIIANQSNIKGIIDLRNFLEHPYNKNNKTTMIENFRLTPDSKITVPIWYVTGNDPYPIKEGMGEIVTYLLETAEIILIQLVMATVKKEIPYVIVRIKESEINPNAPIIYRLSLDTGKLDIPK